MTIARLIEGRSTQIVSCTTATLVHEAITLLAERRIGALPVFAGDTIAGIFSERDVIYRLQTVGAAILDKPVSEAMATPPITVTPETGILEALALMTRRRIRHLPILRDDRCIGFISIGDLVKYRIDRIEAEASAMRDYIQMG